jgi:hypothetical protein
MIAPGLQPLRRHIASGAVVPRSTISWTNSGVNFGTMNRTISMPSSEEALLDPATLENLPEKHV